MTHVPILGKRADPSTGLTVDRYGGFYIATSCPTCHAPVWSHGPGPLALPALYFICDCEHPENHTWTTTTPQSYDHGHERKSINTLFDYIHLIIQSWDGVREDLLKMYAGHDTDPDEQFAEDYPSIYEIVTDATKDDSNGINPDL